MRACLRTLGRLCRFANIEIAGKILGHLEVAQHGIRSQDITERGELIGRSIGQVQKNPSLASDSTSAGSHFSERVVPNFVAETLCYGRRRLNQLNCVRHKSCLTSV